VVPQQPVRSARSSAARLAPPLVLLPAPPMRSQASRQRQCAALDLPIITAIAIRPAKPQRARKEPGLTLRLRPLNTRYEAAGTRRRLRLPAGWPARDIVKIVLTTSGGSLGVHAFGACSPTPCDWRQVPGQAYSASVAGGAAVAFTANYGFGFKNTILAGHLNGAHLIVDDFNVFKDGSGRSPYFSEGTFKKD
jgi:hypothetical protein